jgi:hypothetical protein
MAIPAGSRPPSGARQGLALTRPGGHAASQAREIRMNHIISMGGHGIASYRIFLIALVIGR